ncbi:unnamed protein product [Lampetra planeri]
MSMWDHSCPRLDSNFDPWTCLANVSSWERSSAKNIATVDTDSYKTCIKAWFSPAPGECTVPDPSSRSGSSCSLRALGRCSADLECPGRLKCCDAKCERYCMQPQEDSTKRSVPFQ